MAQELSKRANWSERALEKYLRAEVRKLGGECLKYSNMLANGYPDRLCLFPGGRSIWVELKSTGKRPTQLQVHRLHQLREMGHWAVWADTREKIDKLLEPFR